MSWEEIESLTGPELVRQLGHRMGAYHLSQRVRREFETTRDPYRHRDLEEILPLASMLEIFLRVFRLKSRGESNAILFETIENPVYITRLPQEFEGFRLLHLTDLHFGNNSALMPALTQALDGLEYDLCVLTGDYGLGYSS